MRIDVDALVSISEANQNFSRVARLVDTHGAALILKNGTPRYVLVDYALVKAAADSDADVAETTAGCVAEHMDEIAEIEEALHATHAAAGYCPTCRRVYDREQGACDSCDGPLRPCKDNDPVLLVSVPYMKTLLIQPLLDESGIPYTMESDHGVGFAMRAGTLLETYRFYVPYGAYAQCRDLLISVFGEDGELMASLQ